MIAGPCKNEKVQKSAYFGWLDSYCSANQGYPDIILVVYSAIVQQPRDIIYVVNIVIVQQPRDIIFVVYIVIVQQPRDIISVVKIVIVQQPRASQLVSFLQPFKPTLWILVLVSVKVSPANRGSPCWTSINFRTVCIYWIRVIYFAFSL